MNTCCSVLTFALSVSLASAHTAQATPSALEAAPGAARLRYVALFQESIDDTPIRDAFAENAVLGALLESGASIIKPNPVAGARLRAQDLIQGSVSNDITALDADVVIAATVRVSVDRSGSLFSSSLKLSRRRAALQAVLIAVDTQEVLETFSLESAGIETDPQRATQVALERAGTALAKKLLESSHRIDRRVEILIEALPATAGERLKDALLALPGAKSAKVVYAASDKSKAILFLDASAPSGPELASAIDRLPDAGVVVTGFSERTIHARWSMTRAVRIPLAFARFVGKGRERGGEIATYVRDALLAQGSLTPAGEDPLDLPSATAQRERRLAQAGLLDRDALLLSGRYVERATQIEISAEVRSTRPGAELLVREQGSCPKDQLMTCSAALGLRLLDGLPAALIDRRTEGAPPSSAAIAIKEIRLERELFPARDGAYQTKGIGEVIAENRGPVFATAGRLRVFIPELMAEPAMIQAPSLAPQSTASIPILLSVRDDPRATPNGKLELALEYHVAGRRERVAQLVEVPILERYALDWREARSIAAFVTERVPAITDLADRAIRAIPKNAKQEPFARAAALFHAMSRLSYQRDAAHPGRPDELDDVKLPIETLSRGYGDCEDLAVLYASLAESIGTRTVLVLTPAHVLTAIDSEIPAQSAALSLDPARVLVHKGRAFIPVETTRAGGSFAEAWADGAKVIAGAKAEGLELRVIDVREAHAVYPAVRFEVRSDPVRVPASWDRLEEELRRLAGERAAGLERALEASSPVQEYSVETASRRAMLLLAAGRGDEARRLLEKTSLRFRESVALANNLANIRLASGDAAGAIGLYDRALTKTKDPQTRVRVHLNAAIAARLDRRAELCLVHTTRALAKANTPELRAIVADFLAGLSDGGNVPGVESASFDRAAFALRLRRAIETRGATLGGVDQRGTEERGVDRRGVDQRGTEERGVDQRGVDQRGAARGNAAPDVRVNAADLVYWLGSEAEAL